MRFAKLHALGNDFLVLDPAEAGAPECRDELTRRMCDRHTGVGADGCVFAAVRDATPGLADFRVVNADGGEAEISGNGLRCAAAWLHYSGKIAGPRIAFDSATGVRTSERLSSDGPLFRLRTEMGTPRFAAADIPFDDGAPHDRLVDHPLTAGGESLAVTCVSMGNPHCGIFVDRLPPRFDWRAVGAAIERHPFFPRRTNVEFVRVVDRGAVEVLFWERGVGETLASGSGSCAAAVASMIKGLTDGRVRVLTRLGELAVEWTGDVVFQEGPAEVVCFGEYPNRP
jgi:diaminopimelate epimerase